MSQNEGGLEHDNVENRFVQIRAVADLVKEHGIPTPILEAVYGRPLVEAPTLEVKPEGLKKLDEVTRTTALSGLHAWSEQAGAVLTHGVGNRLLLVVIGEVLQKQDLGHLSLPAMFLRQGQSMVTFIHEYTHLVRAVGGEIEEERIKPVTEEEYDHDVEEYYAEVVSMLVFRHMYPEASLEEFTDLHTGGEYISMKDMGTDERKIVDSVIDSDARLVRFKMQKKLWLWLDRKLPGGQVSVENISGLKQSGVEYLNQVFSPLRVLGRIQKLVQAGDREAALVLAEKYGTYRRDRGESEYDEAWKLGSVFESAGDLDNAKKYYTKAWGLSPDDWHEAVMLETLTRLDK